MVQMERGLFSIQNTTKHYFYAYFAKKERMKKIQSQLQTANHWVP